MIHAIYTWAAHPQIIKPGSNFFDKSLLEPQHLRALILLIFHCLNADCYFPKRWVIINSAYCLIDFRGWNFLYKEKVTEGKDFKKWGKVYLQPLTKINYKNSKIEFWYPLLMFGLGICHQAVIQWTVFYYAPPPGRRVYLLASQIAGAMVWGRVVDAISDPIVAFFSDRAVGEQGRRRPFMLLGTPLFILAFLLLWLPPVKGISAANFFWSCAMLGLFFFSYSAIVVPYLALLPDIAQNEQQRAKLAMLQAVYYGAGSGIAFLVSTFFSPILGIRTVLLLLAFPAAVTILWSVLKVKEKPESFSSNVSFSLLTAWRSVVQDRVFLCWIAVQGFNRASLVMVIMLLPYLLTLIVKITSLKQLSLLALILLIAGSSLCVAYFLKSLQTKGTELTYGKSLLLAGFSVAAFSAVGYGFIPGATQLQAALLFSLVSGPLAIIMLLPNAVVADLAERRRRQKGEHWEALLYALQGVVVKLSMAAGSAILGLVLHFYGGAFQTPAGVRFAFLIAGVLLFLSFFVFLYYMRLKSETKEK